MAFDDKTILNNKLSPLIEGQVPDFVQSDHPVFVEFLKDYYKFLEAGELTISTTTDYIALETNTSSYILDEVESDRVVTEVGAGTKGFFIQNEIITGATSGATATVLVDDSRNARLFISSQQKFITGETITGGTSGSEGLIVKYRANPVQNVQQMLDYADVDNTIYDFLDKMKESFMVDIPEDLATGVSRRDLIKNIKDLYSAKGTSEGHKLFMRILLGETADIIYPNQYMMKASTGDWNKKSVLRVLAFSNVDGEEVISQKITGQTSGATATVVSTIISQQTKDNFNDSVTEFEIANVNGIFQDNEVVSGVSTVNNREVKFTVFGIVQTITMDRGGALYSINETVPLENVGNNLATVVVDEVTSGSVSGVIVDDAGINYEVGDIVTFTANSVDTDVQAATGEVTMIGGGILQETATIEDDVIAHPDGSNIVLEDLTFVSEVGFNFVLEQKRRDLIYGNGTSKSYSLTNIDADTDTLVVRLNGRLYPATISGQIRGTSTIRWTASGNTITFADAVTLGTEILITTEKDDVLLLDRTTASGEDAGYKIESNTTVEVIDTFDINSRRRIALEYDTFENLGATSERGSIQNIRVNSRKKENLGYTKLPTVSVTNTVNGSGAKLLAAATSIGGIKSVKIVDNGFRYVSSNTPDVNFRSHFIVKDVSGTFVADRSLTSHTGTVKSWDSTTNELVIENFDHGVKIVQEQGGAFNEGIQLEQGTELLTPVGFLLEDEQAIPATGFTDRSRNTNQIETVTEDRIVLDGVSAYDPYNPSILTHPFGRVSQTKIVKVTAQYNANTKNWAFYLDGKKQRNFVFYEGDTYRFDLSHPSLYGLQSSSTGITKEKTFAISLTSDGTNGGGTRTTSNITTTQKYGVNGEVDFIRVGAGNPKDASLFPLTLVDLSKDALGQYPIVKADTSVAQFAFNAAGDIVYDSDNYFPSAYDPLSNFNPLFDPKRGIPVEQQFGVDETFTNDQYLNIIRGYSSAFFEITIPLSNTTGVSNPSNYYYYSPNFAGMGGRITIKRSPVTVFGENQSLAFNATDKEEFNFLLEDASQDRTVGADGLEATDKIIMEDNVDFTTNFITEQDLLLTRTQNQKSGLGGITGPSLVTDAIYLEQFYAIHGVSDIQGYINYLAQRYEPTYILNESYIPPTKFWPLFDLTQAGYNAKSVGGQITPAEPKHFIKPIEINDTVNQPNKIDPAVQRILNPNLQNALPFNNTKIVSCFPKKTFNENGNVLLDAFREESSGDFLVLDGTDANGSDSGSLIASEEFGNTLILDGTDSDGTDTRSGFLLDDETGDGNILLNATQDGVDVGSNLINERGIDYNLGITITDSAGVSGKVVYLNEASATSSVGAVSTEVGSYRSISSILGEDLNRLQDSYYYQDYSYEVIVGDSLTSYIDELRRAVHPAGFEPFGKVSIATLVSAAITNTATGVSDYTGDTKTFSPILASVLETIFSQVLQSRLQVPSTVTADGQVAIGSRDDKIVQETGVLPGDNLILDVSTEFNLVLDGIDSNSTDAGDFIVLDGTDSSSTDAGERIVLLDDQASNIIMEDEVLRLELGSDNIVLDGTDEDSSNAGDNIKINAGIGIDLEDGLAATSIDTFLYEQATVTSTKDITSGTGDGGGRIMAETSFNTAGDADRVLVSERTVKIENRPLPKFERNLLLYLAETPFGSEPCGITLETGSGSLLDNIVMDGEIPFTEDAFMELERDSQIDNIILDGTDSNSANAGDGLVLETGFFLKIEDPSLGRESETFNILFEDDGNVKLEGSPFSFPLGFHVSNGSKLLLDTLDNDETILLSDISSLTFAQIRTADKIEIQGLTADEENWGGGADDDNIIMEDFGQILLDQTTDEGANAGDYLIQETTRRNRFTLEESGTLIFEKFSTLSNIAALTLEADTQSNLHGDIIFENSLQIVESFGIKIEDNPDGIIVFDSTDSVGTGDGSRTLLEDFYDQVGDNKVLLEEHNVFFNEGQIPIANYRLNSTNVITKGNVKSADISVRDTGDIALEDATDDTHGYLVINSTSGSSTNAGQNIDLEGATGITY